MNGQVTVIVRIEHPNGTIQVQEEASFETDPAGHHCKAVIELATNRARTRATNSVKKGD